MLPLVSINQASAFIPGLEQRILVLKDISLVIHPGHHIWLAGENGAGKSSLLRLIHGDLWPCAGTIRWQDEDGKLVYSRITARFRTSLVSPAMQDRIRQIPWAGTIGEWLTHNFALDPLSASGRNLTDEARAWLARLDSERLWPMKLQALSQGQLRICLLVRALLRGTPLLLLDEYADGLDERHAQLARECLESLHDSITMLFVSHRHRFVPDFVSEMMEMRDGELGKPKSVQTRKRGNSCNVPERPGKTSGEGQALFEVVNATVYAGERPVLKNISWRCAAGEHWRVSGVNGSGKSTFLRLLAGDELVACGGHSKLWNPRTGRLVKILAERRRLVALVSDLQQALYPYDITGLELVLSGFDNSLGIYRDFNMEERKEAYEAISFFFPDENVEEIAVSSIRRLSSGQLRRLYLARALAGSPSALLLDEPFSLLDASFRETAIGLLQKLCEKGWRNGRPALIFVSHHSEDLPSCVQREACMQDGCLRIIR